MDVGNAAEETSPAAVESRGEATVFLLALGGCL
jgi:hypothetical protein